MGARPGLGGANSFREEMDARMLAMEARFDRRILEQDAAHRAEISRMETEHAAALAVAEKRVRFAESAAMPARVDPSADELVAFNALSPQGQKSMLARLHEARTVRGMNDDQLTLLLTCAYDMEESEAVKCVTFFAPTKRQSCSGCRADGVPAHHKACDR